MSKSDVEMEDPEKLPDSGNTVEEYENKSLDAKPESEGEKVIAAAAVSGDAIKIQISEEENKSVDENKDDTKGNIEVKDETNPMNVGHDQTEEKIENEKLFNTKAEDVGQPTLVNAVDKQFDATKEVVEHSASRDKETEEKSAENALDAEKVAVNLEKTFSEHVEEKRLDETDKENADNVEHVEGDKKNLEQVNAGNGPNQDGEFPTQLSVNKAPQTQNPEIDEVPQGEVLSEDAANLDGDKTCKDDLIEQGAQTVLASRETDENAKSFEIAAKQEVEESAFGNEHEPATPNYLVRYSPTKAGDHSGETVKTVFTQATLPLMGENDDGTPEEQAAFMKEIESFYRERTMDFKPPKFYGQPLNCLKLWRAVIRLGGYDRVTGSKLWRQVGESFHPPKTCTTVSWTFRIFYEKSLLEYERHKTQSGELQLPVATHPEASGIDVEGNGYQGLGSGRARRDAATRAMHGWHVQRLSDYGEVGEPIIKDKNLNNVPKREKNLKSIGSLKQKRTSEVEQSSKAARIEPPKQLAASVVDIGPTADWVKINVRQTKDCFEVYALVPGLLREEVRVQSDPAGRVVITGQPEQVDNPWGITPFKKVVSLPARINPLRTSAVVSLHGRLFVRVPFENSNV